MKEEIKAQWLDALENGEYSQGKRFLHQPSGEGGPDTFCCLGVLCDLAYRAGVISRRILTIGDSPAYAYYGTTGDAIIATAYLPPQVTEWAELPSNNPTVLADDNGNSKTLANLNDSGTSFNDIAARIRASL